MDTTSDQKLSYFNTLIFTIIAGIFSLLLMGLLLIEKMRKWMPMIVTVEIGIFLIIAICIWQIYKNEKEKESYAKSANFYIDFKQCPDYFITTTTPDGKQVCSNENTTIYNRRKYLMKIYPQNDIDASYSLPENHATTYTAPTNMNSNSILEKYEISSIETADRLPDNLNKCKAVGGSIPEFKIFSKLPLTGVKARCDTYIA